MRIFCLAWPQAASKDDLASLYIINWFDKKKSAAHNEAENGLLFVRHFFFKKVMA